MTVKDKVREAMGYVATGDSVAKACKRVGIRGSQYYAYRKGLAGTETTAATATATRSNVDEWVDDLAMRVIESTAPAKARLAIVKSLYA